MHRVSTIVDLTSEVDCNPCKRQHKYTLFYKQHFCKQHQAEIGKKSSKC